MKIIADTNILVRFIVKDDINQLEKVYKLFKQCEVIVIPTHVFCELYWVLSKTYKFQSNDILEKIESLLKSKQVSACEDEIEAGLSMVKRGGDFADGVNAYTGQKISSSTATFVSFDRKAVRLLSEQGIPTLIP